MQLVEDIPAEVGAPNVYPLLEEGHRLAAAKEWEGARTAFQDVLRQSAEAGDLVGEAEAALGLASVEHALGRKVDCLTFAERAVGLFERAKHALGKANAQLSLGDARRALGRSSEARDAYVAATRVFEQNKAIRGEADGTFKLADLLAGTAEEMALRYFRHAAKLYEQHDAEVFPDPPMRIKNPHLPDPVGDCRRIESWIMAHVATRELEKLLPKVAATAAPEQEAKKAKPKRRLARDLIFGGIGIAVVVYGFRGMLFLATAPSAGQLPFDQMLYGSLSLLVAITAVLVVRAMRVRLVSVQLMTALFTFASAYQSSSTLLADRIRGGPTPFPAATGESMYTDIIDALFQVAARVGIVAGNDTARETFEKALQMYRKLNDWNGQVDTLVAWAEFERARAQVTEARRRLAEALTAAKHLEDPARLARLYLQAADLERSVHDFARSREAIRAALQIYQQLDDRASQAKALALLGDAERSLKRAREARDAYRQAVALYDQLGNRGAVAQTLVQLGDLERSLNQAAKAREFYTRAMSVYTELNEPVGQAQVWHHTGRLEARLDRVPQATAAYDKAEELYVAANRSRGRGLVAHSRGRLALRAKRPDEAAELFNRAVSLCSEAQDDRCMARTLFSLGQLQSASGKVDAARESLHGAVVAYEKAALPVQRTRVLMVLGDFEATQHATDLAHDAYLQALKLYQARADTAGEIAALRRLGAVLMASDPAAARAYLARAVTLPQPAAAPPTPAEGRSTAQGRPAKPRS